LDLMIMADCCVKLSQIKSNIPEFGTRLFGTHPADWTKGGFRGKLEVSGL